MSFIDDSIKNVTHQLIREVSGGSVGGFVGGKGMGIDALFAGPYHPDYNEIDNILKQQLKDRKKQDKDGTANPVGGYYDVDTEFVELAYEELETRNQMAIEFSIENTPLSDTEWKSTGWDYDYDEPGEAYKIKDIVYDDKSTYAGENFINQSQTNWEIIDRG